MKHYLVNIQWNISLFVRREGGIRPRRRTGVDLEGDCNPDSREQCTDVQLLTVC